MRPHWSGSSPPGSFSNLRLPCAGLATLPSARTVSHPCAPETDLTTQQHSVREASGVGQPPPAGSLRTEEAPWSPLKTSQWASVWHRGISGRTWRPAGHCPSPGRLSTFSETRDILLAAGVFPVSSLPLQRLVFLHPPSLEPHPGSE